MSLVKSIALVAVSLAIQGAPLSAQAVVVDCGSDWPQARLLGLDRSEADVCADRFALAPGAAGVPIPPAAAAATMETGQPAAPGDDRSRGGRICMRFVPSVAMTVPVACEDNPEEPAVKP